MIHLGSFVQQYLCEHVSVKQEKQVLLQPTEENGKT